MGVAGAAGHSFEVDAVQAANGHALGGGVIGVLQHEMDQVAGFGLADGGQAGQVGAQGGVAVQHEDAAVGLSQGQAQADRGSAVHAVSEVDIQFPAVRYAVPVAQGGGGGHHQRVLPVVVDGAGNFAGGDHYLSTAEVSGSPAEASGSRWLSASRRISARRLLTIR